MNTIALIVAAARNRAIGLENRMPWHLPEDLRYFKAVTLGKPVIMGRKTFESIGRPLPGRANIVVTRQEDWPTPEGVQVAGSLSEALDLAKATLGQAEQQEIMVIGGAEIYRQALPLADKVYLTEVALEPEADTYFPVLPSDEWREVTVVPGAVGADIALRFLVYERI